MNELYDKLNEIALRDAEITEIELHKPMNTKEQDWEKEFDKLFGYGTKQQIVDFIRKTSEQEYQKGLDDGYGEGFRDCEKGVTP